MLEPFPALQRFEVLAHDVLSFIGGFVIRRRAFARLSSGQPRARDVARRGLHLGHVGAQFGEKASREWTGKHA